MNAPAELQHCPAVLHSPPWLAGARAAPPPLLALPPLAPAAQLCERVCREAQATWRPSDDAQAWWPANHLQTFLHTAGVKPEAQARLLAGAPVQGGDLDAVPPTGSLYLPTLLHLPAPLAVHLWNRWPAQRWEGDWDESLGQLIARHGAAAAPGLLAYAQRRPVVGLRVGRLLDWPALATLALQVRRRLKVARDAATGWLLTHPGTSAAVLLRQLFGADDAAREDASAALHELVAAGLRPALDAAARDLGPEAEAAWQAQRDLDPLLRLPATLPRLPAHVDPARLHRPRLRGDGRTLPDEAVRHLALMLAISRPEAPYAGLEAVRAACTPESLAEFAWDLFEAWWAAGAPSAGAWALPALGLLGDTGTVHRMGARVLRLAREGAKHRAVAMVDLLAAEGSDAALMHLDHVATRCKVPVVRNRASAQIDAVAEQRGLSRIELADRLVPTLGLEGDRRLDFGPRQFVIGLDETLTPFVRDADGARLKDLPKPRVSDDRERADAAVLRYKQLKAELRALAQAQRTRLEQAMLTGRRWPLPEFDAFFVQHPLMRELAARLLWGARSSTGALLGACRLAEDGSLADADDRHWTPPADARLGIVHPIELPPDLRQAFAAQWADYEILQPFEQLARATFALTPGEAEATALTRWCGQDVATGAVIGLLDRGWVRGPAEDGGVIRTVCRPFGVTGMRAVLPLSPGMPVMKLSADPRQTLGAVQWLGPDARALPFSMLDRVSCSELLRDLDRLAPSASGPAP